MKTTLLLVFLLALSYVELSAQELNMEFGKINAQELMMESYEKDPDAEAVVLYDSGKSSFPDSDSGFDVLFERRTRIKILTTAGLKYAEFEIPFYHHGDVYEKIYELEAYTFNIENSAMVKTPLDPDNSYVEKINDYWSKRKFAMPNVKPGSVVEIRYKLLSQYKFNLRDWEFQWRIPVVHSEYTVKMIPFYAYTFLLQGASAFDEYDTYEDHKHARRIRGASMAYGEPNFVELVHRYVMKDVAAFRDEEFITSIDDYIMKLDFQLAKVYTLQGVEHDIITTWEELVKELSKHENFGRYITKSEKLASKILNVDELKSLPEEERFNAVLDFVKFNYRYDGLQTKYADKSAAQFEKEKLGNSAELNLFVVGLLRAVGLEADAVISSTRRHGKIKSDYPFESFFNYALVKTVVDEKVVITDATEPMLPNRRIPERCINDAGLVVASGEVAWVYLTSKVPSSRTLRFNIYPTEDFRFDVKMDYQFNDYYGFKIRNEVGNDPQRIEKKLAIDNLDFDATSVEVKNLEDKDHMFMVSFKQSGNLSKIQDKIYINPFLNQTLSENPLKQKQRNYPVDMVYPKIEQYQTRIEIPKGYKIEYIPANKTINNDRFLLNYESLTDENSVTIFFKYYFKQGVYSPKYYDAVRSYFNQIVKLGADKIVFVPETTEASLESGKAME